MLDEALGWYSWQVLDAVTVTAELNVRYRRPVPAATPLSIRARGKREGQNVHVNGRIVDAGGTTLAEGAARLVVRDDLPAAT